MMFAKLIVVLTLLLAVFPFASGQSSVQLVETDEKCTTLSISPAALEKLRDVRIRKVIAGTGYSKSGVSTLLNCALQRSSHCHCTSFACRDGGDTTPKTQGIWMDIWTDKDDGTSIVYLDAEGIGSRDNDGRCDSKLFAVAALLADDLLFVAPDPFTGRSADDLDVLARLTDLLRLGMIHGSAASPPAGVPASTQQRQRSLSPPLAPPSLDLRFGSLTVLINKVDSCEANLASFADAVAKTIARSSGIRDCFDRSAPRVAAIPRKSCATFPAATQSLVDLLATSDASGINKKKNFSSILKAAVAHAECCFPSQPAYWDVWISHLESTALSLAVDLFTNNMNLVLRSQGQLYAVEQSGGVLVEVRGVENAVAGVPWADRTGDGVAPPSREELQQQAGVAAQQVASFHGRFLFGRVGEKQRAELGERLRLTTLRLEQDLTWAVNNYITGFVDKCILHGSRLPEIAVLPQPRKVIQQWAELVEATCTAGFDNYLGKYKRSTPSYASMRAKMIETIVDLRGRVQERSDTELNRLIAPHLAAGEKSISLSVTFGAPVPEREVRAKYAWALSQANEAISSQFKSLLGDLSFEKILKDFSGTTAPQLLKHALATNQRLIDDFVARTMRKTSQEFLQHLREIHLPNVPAAIEKHAKSIVHHYTHVMKSALDKFGEECVSKAVEQLARNQQSDLSDMLIENTKLWSARALPAKRCADQAITAYASGSSFLSLFQFSRWYAESVFRRLAQECFGSVMGGDDGYHGAVPAELVDKVIDEWLEGPSARNLPSPIWSALSTVAAVVVVFGLLMLR